MAEAAGSIVGKIVLTVFAFVDIILLLIPFLMTRSRMKKLSEYSITAEATVIAMEQHASNSVRVRASTNFTPMYYPTFQYTVNGRVYTQPSRAGTTGKFFNVGDKVKVRVDPGDNSKYVLADNPGFKLATGILWAIAGFFTVATIIVGILL